MIRTFILLLTTVLVIIITIPFLIVFLFTSKPREGKPVPKACEWLAHLVLPRLMKIAGADVHITGKENMPGQKKKKKNLPKRAPFSIIGGNEIICRKGLLYI